MCISPVQVIHAQHRVLFANHAYVFTLEPFPLVGIGTARPSQWSCSSLEQIANQEELA